MDNELKKVKFVQMRAEGATYEAISKELEISKPTLISWSKELQDELHNAKALKILELKAQYKLNNERRFKLQSVLLDKIEEAIEQADFSKISKEKLIKNAILLTETLDDANTFKKTNLQLDFVGNFEWKA